MPSKKHLQGWRPQSPMPVLCADAAAGQDAGHGAVGPHQGGGHDAARRGTHLPGTQHARRAGLQSPQMLVALTEHSSSTSRASGLALPIEYGRVPFLWATRLPEVCDTTPRRDRAGQGGPVGRARPLLGAAARPGVPGRAAAGDHSLARRAGGIAAPAAAAGSRAARLSPHVH